MAVSIDKTRFGSITIDGQTLEHDVIIRLSGEVKKRKKKLSKRLYGTSHIVSEEEAAYLYEPGCRTLIIGSGQYDSVRLSEEAQRFFAEKGCEIVLKPTPEAIKAYNRAKGRKAGMFHVTC
jgi:hypothetical protein